jgi:hypothetical protein
MRFPSALMSLCYVYVHTCTSFVCMYVTYVCDLQVFVMLTVCLCIQLFLILTVTVTVTVYLF